MHSKTRIVLAGAFIFFLLFLSIFAARPSVSISAAPPTVDPGGSSTLSWTSSNTVSATINNGIGAVPLSGSIQVTPAITTKYIITVRDGAGRNASASVTVTVSGDSSKVGITSFVATPSSVPIGIPTPMTLSWTTINATSATINNNIGSVPLNGSLAINPTQTTTYILTAKGKGGSITSSATVTFRNPIPPAVAFSASPVTIQPGSSSTLSWNVANAESIYIDNGIGSVAASGSVVVSPSVNTVYTLTASSIEGTTIASSGVYFGSSRPCYAYVPDVFNSSQSPTKSYLKIIDTAINSIIKNINLDNEPDGILVGAGGACIYVSGSYSNKISKIDPLSLQISESLGGFEGWPGEMALHVSGNYVYAIGSNSPTLSVVDDSGTSMVLRRIVTLPAIATGLAVHPNGSQLFVSFLSLNQILVLDTAKLHEPLDGIVAKPLGDELIDTIAVNNPQQMAFNLDGSRLFICQYSDLGVLDVFTKGIIHTYPNLSPSALILNPGGDRIYGVSGHLYYIIDADTLEISASYRICDWSPGAEIALHPDGSRIYFLEMDRFDFFDAGTNTALGHIHIPDRSSQRFYGTWISYIPATISGQISRNNTPLSGATIRLEGEGIIRETQSDIQGNYHFAVKNGSYHLLASYQNFLVTPEFIQVDVNGGNIVNQNFEFLGPAPSPSVNFIVDPTAIQAGESATLSWDSTNANSASINNGIGTVPVDGTLTVTPTHTTTYTITVTGPSGTATANATIMVSTAPPPGIVFSASPTTIQRGQSATLNWTTTNAVSASIDNGIGSVPVNGSVSVTPASTTSYKITVAGLGGSITSQVTVTVTEPLPQVQINADPAILPPGQSATLTWSSVNVTSASIDNGIGTVPISGSVSVTPTQDTTYTITVTGPGGTVMASVTVKMLAGHLQSVWSGMKSAMLAGDINQLSANFSDQTRNRYSEIFSAIADQLPQIAQEMREIEPVYFEEFGAKYRIKRSEIIEDVPFEITYYIYFVQEEDGSWKILNY